VPKAETPDKSGELNRVSSAGLNKEDSGNKLALGEKKKSVEQPKPINNKKANIFSALQ